jgi:hypothetical protein
VEPVNSEEDSPKYQKKRMNLNRKKKKKQIHAALREFVDAFPYTNHGGVKRMKRGKKARVFKNIPSARQSN